jgi:hypothetical protein
MEARSQEQTCAAQAPPVVAILRSAIFRSAIFRSKPWEPPSGPRARMSKLKDKNGMKCGLFQAPPGSRLREHDAQWLFERQARDALPFRSRGRDRRNVRYTRLTSAHGRRCGRRKRFSPAVVHSVEILMGDVESLRAARAGRPVPRRTRPRKGASRPFVAPAPSHLFRIGWRPVVPWWQRCGVPEAACRIP